jgi:flagellar basal body rod protein FlgG
LYPQSRYSIVHLPGEVTPTKRDLDVAIAGDGFFTVRLPDDSIGYTRAGEFSLTPDRTLVNNQGLPILSEGGTTIQLQAQGGPPVINSDGTVRQGDAVLGRLGIAVAGAPDKLINLPGGVFRGEEDAQITPMADPVVQQGYLESSNVKPLTEMIDLVSISRAYEANQRLIQGRDRLLERTLEALG